MTRFAGVVALSIVSLITLTSRAEGQVIGAFRWQTQPFCNLLTLTVIQQGGMYQLTGTDDLCGAGVAPVTGTAVPSGGNVVLGFAVALPGGRSAHITASISLATVSGTWTDADGNTGPFLFTGVGTGGSPRPLPASAAAITVNQFGPTVYAGTGAAGTVARSDHDHDVRYPSRTVTVRYPGSALQYSGTDQMTTFNGCATNASSAASARLPLALPAGAAISAVSAAVYDSAGTTVYFLNLVRETVGATGLSASTVGSATGGALFGGTVTHTLTPPGGVVVGSNDTFYVQFGSFAAVSNGLCSVQVVYTLPPAS